jgi:hypothetical protein
MIDIASVLAELACKRPVFHSEADFQHALAWEIHRQWPGCGMRLEYKLPELGKRSHLDIWATGTDAALAIELKYKTRGLRVVVEGEVFDLSNHGAQDLGKYDFLKDVQRLERVASQGNGVIGYAVLLTNDSLYWAPPGDRGTIDDSFRLHEGTSLTGELRWGAGASDGTIRHREEPIVIKGAYSPLWQDYSEPTTASRGKFRYLLLKVDGRRSA